MTGAFETLLYEKCGPVAYVTLNRPEVINAYNVQMRDDLWDALFAVATDPDVRAMVLCGAGERGFCAGADLSEFGTAPSQTAARRARWNRDVFGKLLHLPKPTIAALHGHVVGSGVELAMLCDMRVAGDDAVFSMPETSLGLIPAAGGTQTLPRTLGPGRALDMLLTGRRLSAGEALRFGLVHRVVARADLAAESSTLAGRLAALDPPIAAGLKRALRAALDEPLTVGLVTESRIASTLATGLAR